MKRAGKRANAGWLSLILVVVLLGVIVVSAMNGAAATDSVIVWNIRAPRIIAAIIIGAGLAVAGVLLQGALRNPLADPALLGVSAGAALGAVVGAALGVTYNSLYAAVFALLGAAVAMGLVVWIARNHGRVEVVTVLLGGIAVTAFASAVLSVVITMNDLAGVRPVGFWSTGSFALSNWSGVVSVTPAVAIGLVIAVSIATPLNVLALGDDAAFASGIDVTRTRVWALLAAVLLTGAGVAVVGVIAFIGLLVPHAIRLIIGPSHRSLMVVSAIAGALVVLVADTVARLALSPVELPVGAVTAIVGAPLFIALLVRLRNQQGGWV